MNCIAVFDPNSSFNQARITGTVKFHQCSPNSNTLVTFNFTGCKPNHKFGVHIHTCGDLTEGCKSACAHFSPNKNQRHGSTVLYGKDRHVGDLCNNLVSDSDGKVNFVWKDDLVSLFYNSNCVIGRMVVLHEKEDDLGRYRNIDDQRGKESGVTGNAGSRIACSIIGITDKNFHNSLIN